MKPFYKIFLAGLITLGFAAQSQADIVLAWDFNGLPGTDSVVAATTVGANVSTSGDDGKISLNGLVPTLEPANVADSFGSDLWPADIDAGHYIEFIVAPTSGFALTLTSVNFNIALGDLPGGGDAPPEFYELRSSLDGYASTLQEVFDFTDPQNSGTVFLGSEFELAIDEAVTFRLYAYGGDPSGVYAVLKNNGGNALTVNAVPEPSTYALLLLGLVGMALIVRARNRQPKLVQAKA